MEEKYLGLKNRIFYKKNKFNPKRKTLVFVHGVSGSSSAWIPFEKKFEKKYNVLTFDLRGHGKSFRPKNFLDYSIEKFSEDIYRLLKRENISNFILISHSFGNIIALEFLKAHQNIVKSAIFISPAYALSKRKLNRIITPLFLIKYMHRIYKIRDKFNQVDYSSYKNTHDWNLKRLYADITNTGLMSYIYSLEHAYKFNGENVLAKIKIPVLIIHGDRDTFSPISNAIKMASKIIKSKLVIFKRADHIIPLNYFKRLSKEIEKFIKCY